MMRWSTMNVRPKLTLLFLLVGLAPLALAAWWSARLSGDALMARSLTHLESSLHNRKLLVENYFQERWGDLTFLSAVPDVLLALEAFSDAFRREGVGGASWQSAQSRFGPLLTLFRDLYHYYDILLVDARGDVIYSVAREGDLGQNVVHGPLAVASLGKVYAKTLTQGRAIQDFASYAPSSGRESAFMATLLKKGETTVGAIVLQIAGSQLDALVARPLPTEELGEELATSHLVGRFEGRLGFRGQETEAGASFLLRGQAREVALAALSGQNGSRILEEVGNQARLVAYAPVEISGLEWAILGETSLGAVRQPVDALMRLLAGFSLLLALGMVLVALASARHFTRPVQALMAVASRLGEGQWHARAELPGSDEMARLGEAFNRMGERIRGQFWVKEGMARLSERLQQAGSAPLFADALLRLLVEYTGAAHGMLFLLDEAEGCFRPVGSHRLETGGGTLPCIREGEGLPGRALLERRVLLLEGLGEGTVTLSSGLVVLHPAHLLLIPLVSGERVAGVVELVSQTPFDSPCRALAEEVSLLAGLTLDNLNRRLRTEALLVETQRQAEELTAQAEELAAQQEALRQTNEELCRQSQELEASEESLRLQQESLRTMNSELEARNQELESRQADLERARRDVELASRYKSEFLANMSHELRTPLNSQMILSRTLRDNAEGTLTPEQVEAARIIYDSGNDLLTLINEILDLSKIEAGHMTVMVEETVLTELAGEIRSRFLPLAREKGLVFALHLEEGLPSVIVTDRQKVKRILGNFLSNAFKFTHRGEVSVRFAPLFGEGRIALSVADSGIGFPEEERETIFEAFRQLDGASNRRYGGTGLGLSISRGLAGLLQGEILCESRVDQGSRFTLLLPLAAPVAAAERVPSMPAASPPSLVSTPAEERKNSAESGPAESEPAESGPAESGRPVLIIEDDAVFARVMSNQVRKKGIDCLVAADAAQGLELARRHRPLGIILDLGLPDAHGFTVLERLKEWPETRPIPVHVISAHDQGMEGRKRGAIGHLTKPVSLEGIELALERIDRFAGAGPRSLLLVEDDAGARTAIEHLIRGQDVEITAAGCGLEALDLLKQRRFDCMILDLGLPDISGFDLLDRMAAMEEERRPPVVIHSGRELDREEYARLKAHTDSIVVKSARSGERLLDEVVLFLHRVERDLSETQRQLLRRAQDLENLLAGRKVLVVDDDVRNVYALTRSLEGKGMLVSMAANGRKALETLDRQPDMEVILMDVMMPEMDGYETIRHIRSRERFARLPIIALTAKAMSGDREKCLAAGASDYLAKPIDPDRLFSLLRVWLYG